MIKLLCKPVRMLARSLYGVLAGAIVNRIWNSLSREDGAPEAAGTRRAWREAVLAAAYQDAIFAVVKAAAGHGAGQGARKLTGVWPGDEGRLSGKAA